MTFIIDTQVEADYKIAWDYLKARGISTDVATACGIKVQSTYALTSSGYPHSHGRTGVELTYYDRNKQVTDHGTVRWIDRIPVTTKGGPPKAVSKNGAIPRGYFPLINDWSALQPNDRVYFHESAIKAINGAVLGKFSIGLAGVWTFANSKAKIGLLPEIIDLPWRELHLQPVIVFDSDYASNPQVAASIARFGAALEHFIEGIAAPIHLPLPSSPTGEKWGFDDARVHHGDAWALEYLESTGVPVESSERHLALVELNEEVVYVRATGLVYELDTGISHTPSAFYQSAYAEYIYNTADNSRVSTAKEWLVWVRRNEAQDLVYEPGKPRFVPEKYFNLWSGLAVEPKTGDITPLLSVLENNVTDPALRTWLLQWCAYPLQHPGAKVLQIPILTGPSGTGKSWFTELLSFIYGRNSVEIGNEVLNSSFNSIYAMKQLLVLNELVRASHVADAERVLNKLKQLSTSPETVLNAKHTKEVVVRNHLNIIGATNYGDSIRLDVEDRRFAIIHWSPAISHKNDEAYWDPIYKWRDGGGASIFYNFLLNLPMDGYSPNGWAPNTVAKQQMVELSRSDHEVWLLSLQRGDIVVGNGRKLFTARELYELYCESVDGVAEAEVPRGFSRQLKSLFGSPVTVKVNGVPRNYSFVGADRSEFPAHSEQLRHINAHRSLYGSPARATRTTVADG